MNDSRDFKKEHDAFLKKVPYQTAVVDGVKDTSMAAGMAHRSFSFSTG